MKDKLQSLVYLECPENMPQARADWNDTAYFHYRCLDGKKSTGEGQTRNMNILQ